MKIEGDRPNLIDVAASKRLEQLKQEETQKKSASRPAGKDNIEVSAEAKLAAATIQTVSESPEVRQDLVDRVRKQILDGEIGHDTDALADRLIDYLLGDR